MVKEGQLVYLQYRDKERLYYDIGVVIASFDQVYLTCMKSSKKVRSLNYDDIKERLSDVEEGVILLKKHGEFVFAKRTVFGSYKY